jgi:nucleoside-diphosphate-sugar epimerase
MRKKRMKGDNVLVTGGGGFIGSHLAEKLLELKNKVICVDNFVTGKRENIKLLLKNPNFTFIEHDVSKPLKMNYRIDQIYHLASPASPVDYQKYPIETMMANSLGTLNMLELAKGKGSKFLLASTSEVYGDPEEHPQNEIYWGHVNPTGPRSCYDESKRFAEALAFSYHKIHGVDVKIARIFNTFGPRMRENDGRAIPNFVNQALNNEPITVYGNGKQTRSFCYISDMVGGLIKLMESEYVGEPFNLGNTNEMRIIDVAKRIKGMTKSESKIVFNPLPEDDPVRRKPDIKKARGKLSWEPKVGLEEGLGKTIDWFRVQTI